ncbi:MAG: hypothetical protein FWF90_17460 [Promicromonosporaceae bacterium]|nr:hypothetical protein [Promicromonosporaceae bacterium]
MDDVQARVTAAVLSSGIRPSQIAAQMGVTRSDVSQKINGIRRWSIRDIERLREVLPPGDRLVVVPERETLDFLIEHADELAKARTPLERAS